MQAYREFGYLPGRDINSLSIASIIEAVEKRGTENIPVLKDRELNEIRECLNEFEQLVINSGSNRLLKDI
jgi:hypothetical protein